MSTLFLVALYGLGAVETYETARNQELALDSGYRLAAWVALWPLVIFLGLLIFFFYREGGK